MVNKNTNKNVITVLCYGDSSLIYTWSNFPFFLTNGLIDNGINVNRVNMYDYYKLMRGFYNHILFPIIRIFNKDSSYTFIRTRIYRFLISFKLKKLVSKYSDSDAFILMSFDWDISKFTNKPIILLGDWTYNFEIKHVLKRNPDKLEKRTINAQYKCIKNADRVFVTWRICRNELIDLYLFNNVSSNGLKAINILNEGVANSSIQEKYNSKSVVFMGAPRYKKGVVSLFNTINKLNKDGKTIKAYYIGISENDCENGIKRNDNNIFLGYLNKDVDSNRKKYYEIIEKSKFCINTNPNSASIASLEEAMFLHTPLIIAKHEQSLSVFGKDEQGYKYCSNNEDELYRTLCCLFDLDFDSYKEMADFAHDRFKDYNWKKTVRDILQESGVIIEK